MTVQELYDQLSDEELEDILTDLLTDNHHRAIEKMKTIALNNMVNIHTEHQFFIYKQAATRWLKNQKP